MQVWKSRKQNGSKIQKYVKSKQQKRETQRAQELDIKIQHTNSQSDKDEPATKEGKTQD